MKQGSPQDRCEAGATLVESMIAFVILAGAAVASYPIFSIVSEKNKLSGSKQLCEQIVRGKLDEYRYGRPVSLEQESSTGDAAEAAAAAAGRARYCGSNCGKLSRLTVGTFSRSSIQGAGGGGGFLSGGFLYSKVRYNEYFPAACNGTGLARILQEAIPDSSARLRQVGIRECVGNSHAFSDVDGSPLADCNSDEDGRVQSELPGFKLYVKLELESPWGLAASVGDPPGPAVKNLQHNYACPNFQGVLTGGGTYSNPVTGTTGLYDFNGAGDGIRVTVTGVLDYASLFPGRDLADLEVGGIPSTAFDRLMCSASTVVYPYQYPVRYYADASRRIHTVHGRDNQGASNSYVFRSINIQNLSAGPTAIIAATGMLSFSVHPRNYSLYVLKGGSLVRYSNCGGVPVDCDPVPNANTGISDDGGAVRPSVQEWRFAAPIRHIGVDYTSGTIIGISADGNDYYQIFHEDGATRIPAASACEPPAGCQAVVRTIDEGAWNAGVPPGRPLLPQTIPGLATTFPGRISGFFLAPSGLEGFISDRASSEVLGGSSYSSTIYRLQDTRLLNPVITLPVGAITFSM